MNRPTLSVFPHVDNIMEAYNFISENGQINGPTHRVEIFGGNPTHRVDTDSKYFMENRTGIIERMIEILEEKTGWCEYINIHLI